MSQNQGNGEGQDQGGYQDPSSGRTQGKLPDGGTQDSGFDPANGGQGVPGYGDTPYGNQDQSSDNQGQGQGYDPDQHGAGQYGSNQDQGSTGGYDADRQGGYDPNQAGGDSGQAGGDSGQQGGFPSQGGYDDQRSGYQDQASQGDASSYAQQDVSYRGDHQDDSDENSYHDNRNQ
ncbi:MAG TPA: hypothetical protein VGD91_08475 [Trebonia sp.]